MLRKLTALCLVCLMVVGLFPTVAFSAWTYNDDYYDITVQTQGGTLYFNAETQSVVGGKVSGDLVIPAQIEGIPVLSIGDRAFQSNNDLTSVELPEGLTVIGEAAFNYCTKLTSANLPSTLERIEEYGLRRTGITKIEIPETLRYIGEEAFAYTSPEALVLPEVPLFLGERAFTDCRTFSQVLIPETVTLSDGVFRNCGGLKQVTLPQTLTELPPNLFSGCIQLKSIELPPNLEVIGAACFMGCEQLTEIRLPDTLRTLEEKSFYGCQWLEAVNLPDSLTYIGTEAFRNSALKTVTLPKNLEYLGSAAFSDTDISFEERGYETYLGDWLIRAYTPGTALAVSEGAVGVAESALYVSIEGSYQKKTAVSLPSTVKYISAEAFLNYNDENHVATLTVHPDNPYICALDNILYSKDLSTLIFCGNHAYSPECKLPQQLRKIGDKAFYKCETLTSITLPDGVEEIGDYAMSAFYLNAVTLSKNLRTIGDYAFADYNRLQTLVIPGKVETIGDYAFSGNVNLYGVSFGKSIRTIGDHAFSGVPLQQAILGEQVESIGDFAFCDTKLRYLHLGSSLKAVGDEAFSQNPELKDVVFPATLEALGARAFYQCEGLERAIFHGPKPVIGDRAFYYDHLIPGENNSLPSNRVEFLPLLTVFYSDPQDWDALKDFYATHWAEAPKQVYLDVPKDSWYAEAVDFASGTGLMNGMGSGRFSPTGTMTRAMVVTVLWRLEGSPVTEKAHSFTDIAPTAWYAEAVNWAYSKGIATGMSDSLFKPDGSITREQLATFLYRYTLCSDPETAVQGELPDFPDKGTVSSYAAEALAWACSEGLINGVKESGITYLRPKASATRAQVAAILMRYF